ncbi:MAG: hypothetical protein HYY04_06630 [Chloroflexi bacterium]|nr:hypothetical protein [Chloroflexota bacterium]
MRAVPAPRAMPQTCGGPVGELTGAARLATVARYEEIRARHLASFDWQPQERIPLPETDRGGVRRPGAGPLL